MSSELKNSMLDSRPPGFSGRGDRYLPDIATELRRVMVKAQKHFASDNLLLDRDELDDLAAALVEFQTS